MLPSVYQRYNAPKLCGLAALSLSSPGRRHLVHRERSAIRDGDDDLLHAAEAIKTRPPRAIAAGHVEQRTNFRTRGATCRWIFATLKRLH
jgi:hypothetical protein